MSTSDDEELRFWNRLAPSYAKKPVPDEAAYQTTLERVRTHLSRSDRVLEFGCGTGSTALALAPCVRELLATDLSSEMVAIASDKALAQRIPNVRFVAGTLEATTPSLADFYVVMAFNLLHLLPDVPATLQRVHSLLRPGGLFISKTPCVGDSSFLLRGVIPLLRTFGRAPFVNFIKGETLRNAVTSAGLEILETGLYPAKSRSLFIVAKKTAQAREA